MRKETYSAGELDQRVQFLREVRADDGMGGSDSTWAPLGDPVWAHVRPMSGREREQFDKVNAEAAFLMVIRYREDIEETDIAEWRSTRFNIRFRKDRPRSRFLELELERGVAA